MLQDTIDYYRQKLSEHGTGARGMDWKDKASQELRFEVISRYIDFSNRPSILDVGCGNGELLAFCRNAGRDVEYLGIDVCSEMVDACRARFGESSARVMAASELATLPRPYDYVIASGTFNAKLQEDPVVWRRYFHASIESMFDACRVAVVLNMMTRFVDYTYERLYYPSLDEVGELAVSRLSRNFIVDHAYPLYEMTWAIFRDTEE